MDTANTKSQRVQQFPFFLLLLIISIVFLLALVIWVECLLRASAQEQYQRTFPSAEQASHALVAAPTGKDDRAYWRLRAQRANK
jgi:hypothetical protein